MNKYRTVNILYKTDVNTRARTHFSVYISILGKPCRPEYLLTDAANVLQSRRHSWAELCEIFDILYSRLNTFKAVVSVNLTVDQIKLYYLDTGFTEYRGIAWLFIPVLTGTLYLNHNEYGKLFCSARFCSDSRASACASSTRTYSAEGHGSDARLRNHFV